MNRGQKSCTPIDDSARRKPARIGQHDEGRQVIAHATKSIGDPCAHAGKAGQDEAAVGHEHGRAVQRGFALHGVKEGHVVHALCELRKEVADPASTLAMLVEGPPTLLTIARLRREELQFAIRIEWLALTLRQLRFVVPGIDMRKTAGAENLDHRLGLGGMMRGLGRERIRRCAGIAMQQRSESSAGEAVEEVATCVSVHGSEMKDCLHTQLCASLAA